MEMPEYRSHKTVRALQIKEVKVGVSPFRTDDDTFTFIFEEEGFEPITVKHEVVARYFPTAGDYYIVYADGYVSVSPKDAFEGGYTKISEIRPTSGFGTATSTSW